MKKLTIEKGLLLTDMMVTYKEQSLHLQRVLVDTSSGSTVISTDLAESIGIVPEVNGSIYRISGVGGSEFVYSKTVDSVSIGNIHTETFAISCSTRSNNFDYKIDNILKTS